jgi:hypothetical protein
MRLLCGLAAAAVLALACTPPKAEPEPAEPEPQAPRAVLPPGVQPPSNEPKISITDARQAPGWATSKITADEVAKSMDDAWGSLTKARGAARMAFEMKEDDDATMTANALLKFGTTGWSIETVIPENGPELIAYRSNGDAILRAAGTETDRVDGKSFPASPGSDLDNLAKSGFERMYAPFTEGRPFWGPLIRDLAAGKKGYELLIEERERTVNNREQRKVLRLVAKQKSGPGEIEITVDTLRWVPLSFIVIDGEPERQTRGQWSCDWSYGGDFSPEDFTVPNLPQSSTR